MTDYPKQLTQLLTILDDIQANDVTVLDVRKQTSITDYMIICSGRSSRHVKSIAETAVDKMKRDGLLSLGSHGMEDGDWVLIDFGDYLLHVMQPDSRAFYNLEGLWQEK
jgi:ribosome-associated protein